MIDIFFHDKTGVVSGFPGQIDGFEHADGNGEIHYYRLFDGVGIMLLRLEMEAYTEIRTQIGRLEVNFCVNGRFETSFSMRDRVLLKPGDMAVSCYDGFHGSSSASCFPLSYYEGICLEIEPAAAGNWIKQNAPAFSVDFAAWKQNLLGCKWYMVGAAGPRCEHVFRELYESAFYEDPGFLQLKTLELLMLLGRIPQENTAGLYCSSEQTVLVHHLRDHLLTNREGYISLASLAAEHEISVSHLKSSSSRSMACRSTDISRNTAWSRRQWSWFAAGSLLRRSRSKQAMTTPANFQRASKSGTARHRPAIVPIKRMR